MDGPSYSNPVEAVQAEPEPQIKIGDRDTLCELVVLRAIYHWGFLRRETISYLTGFKMRQLKTVISRLLDQGEIQSLGWMKVTHEIMVAEIFTYAKPSPTRERPAFFWNCRFKAVESPEKNDTVEICRTSLGYRIPRHQMFAGESVAWLMECMYAQTPDQQQENGLDMRWIPYPESVLRHLLGWYSPHSTHARKWFCTSVPDAWLVQGKDTMRVEMELSRKKNEKYGELADTVPYGEAIIYITNGEEKNIYPILKTVAKTHPNLFVIRLGNTEDFQQFVQDYARYKRDYPPLERWPMREHYAKNGFAFALKSSRIMSQEALLLNGNLS